MLDDDDDERATTKLTREDLNAYDKQFVHDMANLTIFIDWYLLKGDGGLTLRDVIEMPLTMRDDFKYFMRVLGEQREKARRARQNARRRKH